MSGINPNGGFASRIAELKAGILAMRTEQEIRFWSPLCALDRSMHELEQHWWAKRIGGETFLEGSRRP